MPTHLKLVLGGICTQVLDAARAQLEAEEQIKLLNKKK
jgi:hypothetical protein